MGLDGSAADDHVERLVDRGRCGAALSHPIGGVGPGRRRNSRQAGCRTDRRRAVDRARHGRHDRQDHSAQRLRAPPQPFDGSRARLSVSAGQRPAFAYSGDRHDRDRGGRRLDCASRYAGPHQCRAGKRRLVAGAGLLRLRRRQAHRHRCRSRFSASSIPTLSPAAR